MFVFSVWCIVLFVSLLMTLDYYFVFTAVSSAEIMNSLRSQYPVKSILAIESISQTLFSPRQKTPPGKCALVSHICRVYRLFIDH